MWFNFDWPHHKLIINWYALLHRLIETVRIQVWSPRHCTTVSTRIPVQLCVKSGSHMSKIKAQCLGVQIWILTLPMTEVTEAKFLDVWISEKLYCKNADLDPHTLRHNFWLMGAAYEGKLNWNSRRNDDAMSNQICIITFPFKKYHAF